MLQLATLFARQADPGASGSWTREHGRRPGHLVSGTHPNLFSTLPETTGR
jgi:hypothetical protein